MDDILVFDSVSKHYPGFSLRDVSFRLPRGCIAGLVGPNGAGKTTLIRIALGLVRRNAGGVALFGQAGAPDEARARIGFVPDEPHFAHDASLRAIASATAPFYPGWDEASFRGLMVEFGLNPRTRFGRLSQGQKTRFALALALSRGAELLLLDEPTAGLDPLFRRELLTRLQGFLQDERKSVLFSTHITTDLERIADLAAFLHEGRLVFSLPMEDVRRQWRVVRGGGELLGPSGQGLFVGARRGEYGVEALTDRGEEARDRFSPAAVVEPASLEDILVLYGAGGLVPGPARHPQPAAGLPIQEERRCS